MAPTFERACKLLFNDNNSLEDTLDANDILAKHFGR